MSQNNGFRHFRNPEQNAAHAISNKGGVTLAFAAPKHILDLTSADSVQVAFSFCSIDDNFARADGRAVAEQRLLGSNFAIDGEAFKALLKAKTPRDLLAASIMPGLDQEQTIDFQSRVKRAAGKR